MVAERYELSSNDEERLGELVEQLLFEIKLTVINQQIEELNTSLKEAQQNDDWERQKMLLDTLPLLMDSKREICKRLGNRIITD